MYKPAITVLWTSVNEQGLWSNRDQLYSNGTYLRRSDGVVIAREKLEHRVIFCAAEYKGRYTHFQISDCVFVERINKYWSEYYGSKYTNCSAFANYLTTGNFVECEPGDPLVIEQGMRPYEMASRVDVGDMVCLMYADSRYGMAKRSRIARRYRKVKQQHHQKQQFSCAAAIGLRKRAYTAQEIRHAFGDGWLHDYHFMVCVAKRNGEPVWLSQCGRHVPGTPEMPFAITFGEHDPYIHDVPALAFIKKMRR